MAGLLAGAGRAPAAKGLQWHCYLDVVADRYSNLVLSGETHSVWLTDRFPSRERLSRQGAFSLEEIGRAAGVIRPTAVQGKSFKSIETF